jgi:hypothetical protein
VWGGGLRSVTLICSVLCSSSVLVPAVGDTPRTVPVIYATEVAFVAATVSLHCNHDEAMLLLVLGVCRAVEVFSTQAAAPLTSKQWHVLTVPATTILCLRRYVNN